MNKKLLALRLFGFIALCASIYSFVSGSIETAGVSMAAVLLNGPYGQYTGKVGGTVAAIWKGINYLKAYVIPANPNSPGQQAQRTKFKTVVALAQSLIPTLITTFWNPFAQGMSGFNAFVKNVFADMSSTGFITAAAQITKGTLESLGTLTSTYATATGELIFNFSDAHTGNGLDTDSVNALAISLIDNSIIGQGTSIVTRADGTGSLAVDAGLTATNIVVFVWASRGTGATFLVSNSSGDVAASV